MTQPAIVFIHAHPDDECILTGATMAKAAALGFRTIVVYGSRGDAGETAADLGGESLGDRRVREATAACAELGVARIEWLDYADSGMAETKANANPRAFSNADPDEVAKEIIRLLGDDHGDDDHGEEYVDDLAQLAAIVGYDANGTYGHPDHRQVHLVAHALGRLLGTASVLDATYNREYLAGLPDADGSLDPGFAAAEADLTHFVEGEEWLAAKIRALANHASQIPDDWDAENPDIEGFRVRFGTEWFIATPGRDSSTIDDGPLAKLLQPKPQK